MVFRNILLIKHIFNTRITETLKVKCGKEIIELKMEEMFEEITAGNCPGAITADMHYDDCNE